MSAWLPLADGRAGPAVAVGPILRVGVTTRALLDVEAEHRSFVEDGAATYARLQRERERDVAPAGAAMDAVGRLLRLNAPGRPPLVEVVLLSRNPPDLALRAFASARAHGLPISVGSFTGGQPLGPYAAALALDLFLSADAEDVAAASEAGVAAAMLGPRPRTAARVGHVLRVALDGDSVVFGSEADEVFEREGLAAFLRQEEALATTPLARGPFGGVLAKLCRLRAATRSAEGDRVRLAIVTARSAPAHERAVLTLRAWGCEVDEAHFVGSGDKSALLAAYGADLFFDDRETHVRAARNVAASGLVPRARMEVT